MFGWKKAKEPNLDRSRGDIIKRILDNNAAYYNVNLIEDDQLPIVARCDFFQNSEKFLISRKAKLYSTQSEEFLYIFSTEHLDLEMFDKCKEYAVEDALLRMNIGPDHMCSVISFYFITDTFDEEVYKAVRKTRIYKSFRFSLYGWMSGRIAMLGLHNKEIVTNSEGQQTGKTLANILIY